MKKLEFDWDTNKNKENIKKHKVSFEEAKEVFYDYNAIIEAPLTFEKVNITIVDIKDAQNEYKTNTIDLIELRNFVEGSKEI